MNQIGAKKVFSLSVVPPASSNVYAYVWNFWDGSVSVTEQPFVEKVLNIGGNPTLAGRKLQYTVRPVLIDGQSTTIYGEVVVNNPPSIVPSPTLSANDRTFPYGTQISITAYDLENDPISFFYYLNGTAIGGGTTTSVGSVNGTWNGTNAGSFAGYRNQFSTTVSSDRTIAAIIVDNQGGTTALDFDMRGKAASSPSVAPVLDLGTSTSDATSLAARRIGVGQVIDFSVYAMDLEHSSFNFAWAFAGSNGWTTAPVYANGTTALQADGGYKNNYARGIYGETGGFKTAVCRVTNTITHKFVDVPFDVDLIANSMASSGTLAFKKNDAPISTPITATAGDVLELDVNVTDPDFDIVTYRWVLNIPTGALPSATPINVLRLWGQKVILDLTGWPSGSITGTVTAYDRLGASLALTVPAITIS